MAKNNKRKHYVKNDKLYEEILSYHETKEISETLHMYFWRMVNNIIRGQRFSRYTQDRKDDMISDAYLKCIRVLMKFDIKKTKPFSYFTTVIWNSFKDSAYSEKKQVLIKEKIIEIRGVLDDEE